MTRIAIPSLIQMLPVFQALPAVCQFSDPFPASLGEDRNGLVLGRETP